MDEVRIYDGRYSDYRCPPSAPCGGSEHDNSCDDTMKEVEQWMREYPDAPPVLVRQWKASKECADKRTAMMADVTEGDVVLVIDDDELMFGNPAPLREFAETKPDWFAYVDFLFKENGHGTGVVIPLARVFVRSPGLRYTSYFRIVDDQGLVVDMKEDNKGIPYGRRRSGRTYLSPSIRMCELWEYRAKARSTTARDYNRTIAKEGWAV